MVFKRESLIKRIEKLREYHKDLESYGKLTFEEYLTDKKSRYAVERILFLVAENILDFLDHILAAKYGKISEGYEDILDNSFKRELIEKKLYEKLRGIGGFRNILAHEYLSLDDEEVYRNFTKIQNLLPEVITHFDSLI